MEKHHLIKYSQETQHNFIILPCNGTNVTSLDEGRKRRQSFPGRHPSVVNESFQDSVFYYREEWVQYFPGTLEPIQYCTYRYIFPVEKNKDSFPRNLYTEHKTAFIDFHQK